MERKLHDAQQRKSSVISMPDGILPNGRDPTPIAIVPPQAATGKVAKRKERLNIDELVSDFGFL